MRILHVALAGLTIAASVTVAAMTACGGNGGPVNQTDAPMKMIDASSGVEPACTGALYDPCTDTTSSSDCMTGPPGAPKCMLFAGSGYTVCTQTCTTMADCALQDGAAVFCNPKGICKPGHPNACTR